MKKVLAMLGLLVLCVSVSHAGTPKDQSPNSWTNFMHGNAVIGSTVSVANGINNFSMGAPGTSQGQNCQVCLTRLILQLGTNSTGYLLESGTTDYTLLGQGLGQTFGVNTIQIIEDHLGPLCFQNGNTPSVNIVGTTQASGADWEGFIDCGGSRN